MKILTTSLSQNRSFLTHPKRIVFLLISTAVMFLFMAVEMKDVFATEGINQAINFQDKVINKRIVSTDLAFSGAMIDIATGTDEHFAFMPNGIGNVGIGIINSNTKFQPVNTSSGSYLSALQLSNAGTGVNTASGTDFNFSTNYLYVNASIKAIRTVSGVGVASF